MANSNGYGGFLEGVDNVFTGNLDWERTLYQNAVNANEAQKNRDFQRYMSNTSYQRAVADAKAAGLNPYTIGISGSSTPSGSTAHAAGCGQTSAGKGFGMILNAATALGNFAIKGAGMAMNARELGLNREARQAMNASQIAFKKAQSELSRYSVRTDKYGRVRGATHTWYE